MDGDQKKIDLFPLTLVLFPGSRVELHIFEDRYRTMIRQCQEEEREFGIVLYQNNQLHEIGCTASVRAITQHYTDGSYDIVVEGGSKFRLTEITQTDTGYFQGIVEQYPDEREQVGESVILRVMALYNALLDVMFPEGHAPMIYDINTENFAYQIAEKAGMDLKDRQRILELPSESQRLELLALHLETAIPRLKDAQEIKRVVANDGYLPRSGNT